MQILVLIDAGLPDLAALLGGLRPGCQAVPVSPDQDALEVLAAAVGARSSPGGWQLAVVAHGAPGAVIIGSEPLTAASIDRRRQQWRRLAPAAIDLFSCFAGSEPSLVEALAAATGAPVAASARTVGHAALGGSWQLDRQSHRHAANGIAPFSTRALAAWRHRLATLTVGTGVYNTIQSAINAAVSGDIIEVQPGVYNEQVTIDRSLTLRSTSGAASTIITSPGGGYAGAITVAADVQNVTIGGAGQGFTLNANPANPAALYLVQNNDGAVIRGNTIQGGSTGGLLTGGGQNGLTIDANAFSGSAAVPLAYVNGAASLGAGLASSAVAFTANSFTGSGSVGLLLGTEAGASTITGNTFSGANSYAQLEVWEPGHTISGNSFNGTAGVAIADSGSDYTPSALAAANSFLPGAITIQAGSGVFTSLQGALNTASAGDTIDLQAGTYSGSLTIPVNNLTINIPAGASGFSGAVLGAGVTSLTLGGDGAFALTGNGSDNIIVANGGANTINGGLGNDSISVAITAFSSADSLVGGGGTDTLRLSSAGSLADAAFTNASSLEVLRLADGSNALTLGSRAEAAGIVSIVGGSGADAIDASGFSTTLTISGGSGSDSISLGSGDDSVSGGGEGDRLQVAVANLTSADSLDGGGGSDTLALSSAGSLGDAAFTNLSSLEVLQLANGSNSVTLAAKAQASGLSSVIGGSGADWLDITAFSPAPRLALGDGADTVVVAGSFNLSDHSGIETLQLTSGIGSSLTGDAAANQLIGNSGNDTLDGGAGNDILAGSGGNDLYITDSSSDVVQEAAAAGADTVRSSSSYGLPAEVETLVLTGSDNINGVGNSLANLIIGNGGNNILDGLTGNDTMVGGAGNDYYGVNSTADVVTELSGEGSDTIFSGVSLTLPANVETLVLSGLGGISAVDASAEVLTASSHGLSNGDAIVFASNRGNLQANTPYYLINATTNTFQLASAAGGAALNLAGGETGLYSVAYTKGSSYNLSATGNSLDNLLVGNAGANTFNANFSGGGGEDTMQGGAGDDIYYFDSAGDTAIEGSDDAAGTDVVFSSVNVDLLPDNVENLVLSGSADLVATGNGLANIILGNAGNNTIDGGRGIDSLAGGAGNDLYLVDVSEDYVEELFAAGTDTIRARESYTAPFNVERVELSGTGRYNLTGNSQANILVGNESANVLDGGSGNDTLEGLGGNDSYIVDSSADLVIEAGGGGRDTITSSVSYTLPANVETLVLNGSASLSGVGNSEANTLVGNDGANMLDGGAGADLLMGGAGNDSYVLDDPGDRVVELSGGGSDTIYSSVALSELFDEVETVVLTGSADLAISGNNANNLLFGNAGANTIDGGGGDDTLLGGGGNDLYRVDSSGDLVIEASAGGTDTISTSVSLTSLPDNVEVLVAAGRSSALLLTGNSLANTLIGGRGADTLDGGAGNDNLYGLGGSDVYLVDSSADLVQEGNGPLDGRNDIVIATTSITSLADNVETLILSGSANLSGTGNSGRNTIIGNSGNNTLSGGGGKDDLIGAAGNDFYVVDSSDDKVVELSGEGSDTISSSVSISALADQVEVLILSGSSDLNGTGNAGANLLIGNSGANGLSGGGGADTMIGGAGNDRYIVDSSDDMVVEQQGEGSDTISSSVSLLLPDNVETASLNSSASLALVGNGLANLLIGNRGDDTLNGGVGADTLDGGRGNDVYVIDNSGDVVIEAQRSGLDTVLSSISTSLPDNVENLTLLDSGGAINGSGNEANNTITGNSSANLLRGLGGNDILNGGGGNDTLDGGAGADVLAGGSGADLFRFSSSDEIGRYSKVDTISDFNPGEGDRIDLSGIAGSLGRALTWLGTSPYSGSAGQVRYDSEAGVIGLDLTGNARNTTSIRISTGLSLSGSQFILS